MNKELTYINFTLESLYVINDLLNNKNCIEEVITKIKSQNYKEIKRLDNLLTYSKKVLNSLSDYEIDKNLNKYYNKCDDNSIIVSFYIVKEELKKTNKEARDYFFDYLLEYLNGKKCDVNDIFIVVNNINLLELNDSSKLALIDLYFNYDKIIQEFDLLISVVSKCLRKHIFIIKEELENSYNEAISSKYLFEKHQIKPKKEDRLYLSIYTPNQITLTTINDNVIYYYGYFVQYLYLNKNEDKNSFIDTIATIKTLGDPTRFNIIKLLKENEMCNQDLAKALMLTEATLSFHLDNLIKYELVLISRIEKRKYFFALNKKRILYIAQFIKELTDEKIS